MRRVLLRPERVVKQTFDDVELAQAFLDRRPDRPGPEWYASLLDEHGYEIALVIAAWLAEVRDRLAAMNRSEWGDVWLWFELEQSLAFSLAPALRSAAGAAVRRQAVEANEPVSIRMADLEIAIWAGAEAARQAQLIASESRAALDVALRDLTGAGLDENQSRSLVLDTGLFGLHQRFAESVLRRSLAEGATFDEVLSAASEHGERLLAVRGEAITQGNAVDAIHRGMATAALLWSQDGKIVMKTWVAVRDELLCPVCASLHMQTVRRDQLFVAYDGSTYEHPKAHLHCRCFVQYSVRITADGLLGAA